MLGLFAGWNALRGLRYEVATLLAQACPTQLQISLGLAPTAVLQGCRNTTAADFFISVRYWRAALLMARMACQASVASSHALASRNFVYAHAKAGIFISLSRVRLNRR